MDTIESQNRVTNMPCIVCGKEKTVKLYDVLLQCLGCGFIRANLNVTKESLDEMYSGDFFKGGAYVDYLNEEKVLTKSFKRDLKLVSKFCPSGRMLEIGCAYGFFLNLAKDQYDAQGIDIGKEACAYAKEQLKLDVICGDFLEHEFKENYYDIIVMWATIEHLEDPRLYIKKISRLLKPGGVFICTAPDIGSVVAKIRKKRWRQINLPTHLNYFTKSTLEKLLGNYGLKMIKTRWLGEYRTIDNTLYIILVLRNKMEWLYSWLKKWGLNRGWYYLNTYDQLCAIVVKQ